MALASADLRERRTRLAGIAFIVASALAFGAMAILARVAYADGVDIVTLLALRFSIAAACLVVIARIRRIDLPRGRDFAAVAALGGIGYGGQAATFFVALTLAPAGLVALLLYLHPALVAVLAAVLLHERMPAAKLLALVIALIGLTLTVAPALSGDSAGAFPRLAIGIALGLAAATIYSGYIIVATRLTERVSALALATVVIASAAVVFAVAATIVGPQFPRSLAGWAAAVGIALICTVAAVTLYFAGLARVGPTRASTLSTIEPVFTIVLAWMLLGERVGVMQALGGLLILAAVVMLARAPSHDHRAAALPAGPSDSGAKA